MIIKCCKCKIEKTSLEFYKNKNIKNGFGKVCKVCRKQERPRQKEKNFYHQWLRDALNRSKQRALLLGLPYNLTYEYLQNIHKDTCPVLGIKLDYFTKNRDETTPSLERIDNNKGYLKGNVCIISLRANILKNNATIKEMEQILSWYKTVYPLVEYFVDEFNEPSNK